MNLDRALARKGATLERPRPQMVAWLRTLHAKLKLRVYGETIAPPRSVVLRPVWSQLTAQRQCGKEIGLLQNACGQTEHWKLDCGHTEAGVPWCITYGERQRRTVSTFLGSTTITSSCSPVTDDGKDGHDGRRSGIGPCLACSGHEPYRWAMALQHRPAAAVRGSSGRAHACVGLGVRTNRRIYYQTDPGNPADLGIETPPSTAMRVVVPGFTMLPVK
jgi:hypothetical protein